MQHRRKCQSAEKTLRCEWPVEGARRKHECDSLAEGNAGDRQQVSRHCPERPQRNTATTGSGWPEEWTPRMQIPHADAACTPSSTECHCPPFDFRWQLRQFPTDFQTSFTGTVSGGKFVTKLSLKIPPHPKRVATLGSPKVLSEV